MSIKLVILGLMMEANRHPYEIRQMMKDRGMHHYIKMQDGSLYYAIDRLKKDGCIEVVETIREGNRPDRTIYRITEDGKALFQKLLLEQFKQATSVFHPLSAALVFAHNGDQAKIYELLKAKIVALRERTDMAKELYEEHIPTVPRSVLHMMYGFYEHSLTELKWLERLAEDAKNGRLKEIGSPLN
ncbi:PadR family transcriptional regulator [Paenibacillus thalictri]|uniref:PadR family transcriptional regulator n=1 Tax=Paenibacillus thalictri TaxID=2527873 RepID=A0A4Q9DXH5_9BACL|nr:PadR family transcriptional regulator [Paenibacillus thalictri]TBL81834.1 PadR family transcriptional regulator [Paenibacillus thalictri]